jgi:hypothetical protein
MSKTRKCPPQLNSQQCELFILERALQNVKEEQNKNIAMNPHIQKIIQIAKDFIIEKKLLVYGGLAINNILPSTVQFYKPTDFPDYDAYSSTALLDAKELADRYNQEGFNHVEAKSGVHIGTFKVYVDFIQIMDITQMVRPIFTNLIKESINIGGVHYAPPTYLKMAIYLELSRPTGDISRWEKISKRLQLLNTHFPMEEICENVVYQRRNPFLTDAQNEELFYIVRNHFIEEQLVFLGSYANRLFVKYGKNTTPLKRIADFDVFSMNPRISANLLKTKLSEHYNFGDIRIKKHKQIGELVPEHYQIFLYEHLIAMIYKPDACYSYNMVNLGDQVIRIATIDTILRFYLAFIYVDKEYYDKNRILCMAQFLMEMMSKSLRNQRGILKRFSLSCIGLQKSLQDIRREKAEKYRELKHKRKTKEWEYLFLKYNPRSTTRKRR